MRHDDWPSEVKDAARKGLDEQAANRTVALYIIGKDPEKADIGTGVCLSYRGQFLIATAAHLIRRWGDAEIGMIPKAAGNLETNPARVVSRLGFVPKSERVIVSPHPLDDLAVLHLRERPRGMGDESFYSVDLVAPPPVPAKRQVKVYGYPLALVRTRWRDGKLVFFNVSPLSDSPKIARVARDNPIFKSRDYNPALHFLMDFPQIRGAVDDPEGMSGAGVWSVEPSGPGVWQPRLRLIGIQIAWHQGTRLLVATRVRRLWRILEGLF